MRGLKRRDDVIPETTRIKDQTPESLSLDIYDRLLGGGAGQ
jgi:hypothetical protein